ncbi:MAG: SURF1 family protein [Aeromicrobium sp.]
MSLKDWFKPGLLGLHLFAIVAIVACVFMGLWQAGVYDSRQEHERAESQTVPRVALDGLWGADDPFENRLNQRPVTIEGQFAPADEQVWVAGKTQNGQAGVWLLSPVIVGDAAIAVVRGWAPAVTTFPSVPTGEVTIEATLQSGEGGGAPFDPKTREIGAVRIPALTNELPYDLYSGFAISSSAELSGGLDLAEIPAKDVPWTTGLRNLAYALQWWVFGAFALFMWWRMATESIAAARAKVA